MTVQFACEACGNPSVVFPPEFTDESSITCKGCGRRLGSWADFKQRTRQLILAEAKLGDGRLERLSADPLPGAWPRSRAGAS